MTKDDEILALKAQLAKAQKAQQLIMPGMEGAQLTPLQYRFATIRGRYPSCREHSDQWCVKEAGSDSSTVGARRTLASKWMKIPAVKQLIDEERARQSEVLRLDGDYVLAGVIELKDMCMGKKPIIETSVDEDGNPVVSSRLSFNPTVAAKTYELLGKHQALWTDKTELTGKDGADLSVAREVIYVNRDNVKSLTSGDE